MKTRTTRRLLTVGLCCFAFVLGLGLQPRSPAHAQEDERVFEIRMYTVEDDKVDLLSQVFRNNVTKMFAKHGITNVAYFIPQDDPRCTRANVASTIRSPAFNDSSCEWSKETLIYILSHPSRAAGTKNWASFGEDADGLKSFREDYARAGVQVMKIESVFMDATDYSSLR